MVFLASRLPPFPNTLHGYFPHVSLFTGESGGRNAANWIRHSCPHPLAVQTLVGSSAVSTLLCFSSPWPLEKRGCPQQGNTRGPHWFPLPQPQPQLATGRLKGIGICCNPFEIHFRKLWTISYWSHYSPARFWMGLSHFLHVQPRLLFMGISTYCKYLREVRVKEIKLQARFCHPSAI